MVSVTTINDRGRLAKNEEIWLGRHADLSLEWGKLPEAVPAPHLIAPLLPCESPIYPYFASGVTVRGSGNTSHESGYRLDSGCYSLAGRNTGAPVIQRSPMPSQQCWTRRGLEKLQ
jgi:hypothetical protein